MKVMEESCAPDSTILPIEQEYCLDDIYSQLMLRMTIVADKIRPYFELSEKSGNYSGRFEVFNIENSGITPFEFRMFQMAVDRVNSGLSSGTFYIKPGITHSVFAGKTEDGIDFLYGDIIDFSIESEYIEEIGFQFLPPGAFVELTPKGSDLLIEAIPLGAAPLTLLLAELGLPPVGIPHLVTLILKFDAALIEGLKKASSKNAIRLKLMPMYPFPIPLFMPA